MIKYGDRFKLMSEDDLTIGTYEFLTNIGESESFYYRDANGKILVSEKGQWIGDYNSTTKVAPQDSHLNEDAMVKVEEIINNAFEQFGNKFAQLLEEKINEIKEQIDEKSRPENRIMTREEFDREQLKNKNR